MTYPNRTDIQTAYDMFVNLANALEAELADIRARVDPHQNWKSNAEDSIPLINASKDLANAMKVALDDHEARITALEPQ